MSELLTARAVPDGRAREAHPAPEQREKSPRSIRPRLFLLFADLGVAESFFLLSLSLAGRLGLPASTRPFWSDPEPIFLAVVFPLIVGISGLYKDSHLASWRTQAGVGLRALAWSIGISVGAVFLFAEEISWNLRVVLLLYQALLGVWLLVFRPMAAAFLHRRYLAIFDVPKRVLMVGADKVARDIARALATHGTSTVGFVYPERPGKVLSEPFYHAPIENVPSLARELDADLVVIARPDLPREQVVRLSDELVAERRHVHVVSNVFNKLVDSVPFDTARGVPLVAVGQTPLQEGTETLKRVFDLVGTAFGGLLISPLLLLIAILVRLSSPGPIIYTQRRVGRDGQAFDFYKFRTMSAGNDDTAHRDYIREFLQNGDAAATDKSGKPIYKIVDDSRVTPIGKFLRRTSLDELPQLINVIRGEMSLIGPRPCLPFEYELYQDWQKRRLSVTPGMTGLWQVTGRSYVSFEDMVLLDLFYIANWSFGMDLKILFRTVPVVIWGKGGA